MPVIQALRRLRKENCHEFNASEDYMTHNKFNNVFTKQLGYRGKQYRKLP